MLSAECLVLSADLGALGGEVMGWNLSGFQRQKNSGVDKCGCVVCLCVAFF